MTRFRIGLDLSGARPWVAGAWILAAAILLMAPVRASHATAPDDAALAGFRLAQAEVVFGRGEVVIETRDGARRFTVEVARTVDQRQRGLMYRTELARDGGMLFVFDQPGEVRMWMKNTLIPLDMLFIEEDGRILSIARRTTPLSEKTIASGGPVSAVLELAAGTAERLGIAPGDRVRADALAAVN